jgi:tetratricopeptide (TPR) repeat protein
VLEIKSSNRLKATFSANVPRFHIAIILLLGIVSYANSFTVPIQFDDRALVLLDNNVNADLFSMKAFIGNARWFADITFALNRHLHGERVFGFHLFNLAIHLASAVAVYLLIRLAIDALKRTFRITVADGDGTFLQRFIPFATAALFVCHPIQTQAVTYIAQRYTSLATLLYLGSLLSYLLARLMLADDTKKLRAMACVIVSVVSALLAMKSKEIAFTLPLMIVAFEVVLFRGEMLKSRLFLALGALLLSVIPLQLIYSHGMGNPGNLLNQIQAAATETHTITRIDYLLTQLRVVSTYLRLLVLPLNQNLDYDYPVFHSLLNPQVFAALLLHLLLAALAVVLFLRSKRCLVSGKPWAGISMRLAGLGIFWFYLALCVESSFIPIKDVIFEHRLYLPSAGLFMAVTAAFAGMAAMRPRYQNALWVALALICIVFSVCTISRNRIWSDEMLLWQDVLKKSPEKARARYNVGLFYSRKFMFEQALPHLVKALELDANQQEYWLALNAALPLLRKYEGRCSAGYEYQSSFVKVDPDNDKPWMANSYNNLGLAYEHLGELSRAQENYLNATAINPALEFAWYNLALIAARRHDDAAVATSLNRLQTINPPLARDVAGKIREQQPDRGTTRPEKHN